MILFTADWHIKLGQKNVPKKWALNRYYLFFSALYGLEAFYDLHIIGGDIFDRIPSMEELALYFDFISKVQIPTIIYDGNHEATRKNKTFFTQLIDASKAINPLITVIDKSWHRKDYSILPYADLHKKGSIEKFDIKLPIFTHVRGQIPPHVKPEVDLDRFSKFPIVFAGDLHAHSNTQLNIVYPGSPMTTSFHRTEVQTGYISINDDWTWDWRSFDLPQLIRKTVQTAEEMIATEWHHTIYEIEGDIQKLASIKNSDLLDKKVIKRKSEAALILGKDMPIDEELFEYLTYILEFPEKQAQSILGSFHDYYRG